MSTPDPARPPTTTPTPPPTQQPTPPAEMSTPADKKPAADPAAEKVSGAELKKKAKAEKAARRARERADREATGGTPGPKDGAGKKGAGAGGAAGGKDAGAGGQKGQRQQQRRGSTQGGPEAKKRPVENKNVAVFGHLYGQPRRTSVAGAGKEVHPAVLALGLQMRDYVVCGSSARCVATLLAFKRVCLFYFFVFFLLPRSSSLSYGTTAHNLKRSSRRIPPLSEPRSPAT